MAITLNRHAAECERIATENGMINEESSSRVMLYEISRSWRSLCDATDFRSNGGQWSEKETEAANIIINTLCYLRRIGCYDIEQLIKERINDMALKK